MRPIALRFPALARGSFFSSAVEKAHIRRDRRRCRARSFEQLETRRVFAAIQNWQVRGPGGGGALYSPSFNPVNPQEIYIGSDMGQIFHSTDDGHDWNMVDYRQTYGGPNSKVQFTSNPQILYTIDYSSGGDVIEPTKSVDGGADLDAAGQRSDRWRSDHLDCRLQQSESACLVSDYSHLWISTDGGATFTQRFSTSDPNGLLVAGAFFDGNNIYVGTNQGLLTSTNGGATNFTVADEYGNPQHAEDRIVCRGQRERHRAVVGRYRPGSRRVRRNAGLRQCLCWRLQDRQPGTGPIDVDFDQRGPRERRHAFLCVGGTERHRHGLRCRRQFDNTDSPTVFRSTNGGGTWQSVFQTANNANIQTGWSGDGGDRGWSYGEFALGFEVDPLDSTRMIITDLGFAHLSEDSGGSWKALYVNPADLNAAGSTIQPGQAYQSSGLENSASWYLTWTSPTHMIAGYSDIRAAESNDGGASWSFNYTGDSLNAMYRSIVVNRGGQQFVYAATSSVHDMYQSTYLTDARIDGGTGQVLFSTNGGTTWQMMHNFGHVVTWVESDPNNPNRLYASVANSIPTWAEFT